jgi:two-component system KDP operon response regulator KdpE
VGKCDPEETDITNGPRILVVEDDERTGRLIDTILSDVPALVDLVPSAMSALEAVAAGHYDLITIDIGLPDLSGIELIKSLATLTNAPILVISGEQQIETVVQSLEAGAEDYVMKPFRPPELTARVRAGLRRGPRIVDQPAPELYEDDAIVIDLRRNLVRNERGEESLTSTERRLLSELLKNAGRVVTRDELLERVWGSGYEDADANLHVFVSYVRRKLEPDPSRPRYIKNHRGIGYEFVASAPPDETKIGN